MADISAISPELLRDRHRLSPQQINAILGSKVFKVSVEEKALMLRGIREFILLSEAFQSADIRFIPLKGPILSYRLYGDVTYRHFRDFDILIEKSSVDNAVKMLLAQGYNPDLVLWPSDIRRQNQLMKHGNQISFSHPERKVTVELHWRLLQASPYGNERLDNLVWSNLTNLDFAGRSFYVLSHELELLYLIIHGGLHCWRRLKWLADIDAIIIRNKIDGAKFSDLAEELKANRMISLCRAVHSTYFPGTEVKFPWKSQASGSLVVHSLKKIAEEEDIEHNTIGGIIRSRYHTLISFPGLAYKFRIIRNYMFVAEFYRGSGILTRVPLFYFYSLFKLSFNRIKR